MTRTSRHTDRPVIEARVAARLASALSATAQTVPHEVGERLRFAREQALARAAERRRAAPVPAKSPALVPTLAVAGAGGLFGTGFGATPWWQRAASVLPLLVLVAGLIAIDRWAMHEQVLAAAEIDAELLADDLPPAAYSDPGFAEYLRSAPLAVMLQRALVHWLGVAIAALLVAGATVAADEAGPRWAALTPSQQQALAPLQRDWPVVDATRKQKWLEVAARFPAMPAAERARIQQRMADWAKLSTAERTRARLQFQETRQLPAEERQARWDAYQALTEDERKNLAQRARPAKAPAAAETPGKRRGADEANLAKRNMVVPTTAPPTRPVAPTVVQAKPGATTTTMSTRPSAPAHHQAGLPKIAATPGFVDPATLLPKRGPQGAAVRTAASKDPTEQP